MNPDRKYVALPRNIGDTTKLSISTTTLKVFSSSYIQSSLIYPLSHFLLPCCERYPQITQYTPDKPKKRDFGRGPRFDHRTVYSNKRHIQTDNHQKTFTTIPSQIWEANEDLTSNGNLPRYSFSLHEEFPPAYLLIIFTHIPDIFPLENLPIPQYHP